MDDYLSARPITSPFGLYDCDVPCDGSIAVIVSAASVADDLPHPAVRIEAVGTQILERVSWDQDTLTHEPQVIGQAAHLWTRTGHAAVRGGPGAGLRRLHLQRHLVARGPRVLRLRRGLRLARRRASHRPRRRAPGQSARWAALRGPEPRLRLPLRGGHPAAPRRRRAPGARTPRRPWSPPAAGRRPASCCCSGRTRDVDAQNPDPTTTTGRAADKPSGPRSRKGVETRARLLAAAKEVFEQDGFLDARISDIAERAGLSHGSFYHYFESKEEVFREVAAEVEQRLSEPLYSVILDPHSTASPYERIHEGSGGTSRATATKPASWV